MSDTILLQKILKQMQKQTLLLKKLNNQFSKATDLAESGLDMTDDEEPEAKPARNGMWPADK